MLSEAFISQQRDKLIDLQRYYQAQSTNNGGVENISDKKAVLVQIRIALELIHSGDYGYCEECDEEILIQRLHMVPQATRCATCQEVFEKDFTAKRTFQAPQHEKSLR